VSPVAVIHVTLKPGVRDVHAESVARQAADYLRLDTGRIKTGKLYSVIEPLTPEQLRRLAREALCDLVINDVRVDARPDAAGWGSYLLVGKLPGITDDEGMAAQRTAADLFNLPGEARRQSIYVSDVYFFERELAKSDLLAIASELLGNPLVHHFDCGPVPPVLAYVPSVFIEADTSVETVDLRLSDEELLALSRDRLLSLNLTELSAIRDYYGRPGTVARLATLGRPAQPTDCELEVLAQTWSEHCKHKEFNALITYVDEVAGTTTQIDSLFKTFIRGSTEAISERLRAGGHDWLVTVFNDNAGVVRIDEQRLFVWKVETHNSPSALDPFGGAITGILGNNRDPLGTGRGGAKLLFNTNVLCFGPPSYDKPLLSGQLHPQRVMDGVRRGIEEGGNKSGIPTVNGAIVFDDRYAGKPLVYCGTGAVMDASYGGRHSWTKEIAPGDRIVVAGGRVGRDGIHGATFSSVEIDRHSPRTAVQVGSPITQKLLSDFLETACRQGLVKCSTDNGAGGLSSSIGELALLSNGAELHLERVPLKYAGLRPWEILVSESQERMSLVVEPGTLPSLLELADRFEVECSDIGSFTDSGLFEAYLSGALVATLDLDFLHHGVPRKTLSARWRPPATTAAHLPPMLDHNELLTRLLGSANICSREEVIRQYDHEVKGKTIVKPLMGAAGVAPQDAAVMRLGFEDYAGVAISCGILPRYGDLDAYQMSAGSFDEAVRQIISIGGRLPDPAAATCPFWSVNDNFCVPDSVYHPDTNPDGEYKLAQLVRMCQALYDMATFFNIPMTSGKDSMKNDLRSDGTIISVPPTVLYSMVAGLPDVRLVVTSEFKAPGDLVYLVGATYDELGGSELYRLFDQIGTQVPQVRPEQARRIYQRMGRAHDQRLLESCHDCSDGGLAVAATEAAFGGGLGMDVEVSPSAPPDGAELARQLAALYSESHSRFVASVRPAHQQKFEEIMGPDARALGRVTASARVVLRWQRHPLVELPTGELLDAWRHGLARARKGR
jgi:phosphoribosylformylglycinamidine synthase